MRNYQHKIFTYKNYADKNNPEGFGSKTKKNGKNGKTKKEEFKPRKIVKVPVLEEVES